MGEREDLLAGLSEARGALRRTLRGVDDDQARQRTTVSALCLGGIVKHLTAVERMWRSFMAEGPSAFPPLDAAAARAHARGFVMEDGDTLAALLERYEAAAAATDEHVASCPDLDATHPLPPFPWVEPGTRWSIRHVVLHLVAETAQHAGHADIVREALDGARSTG